MNRCFAFGLLLAVGPGTALTAGEAAAKPRVGAGDAPSACGYRSIPLSVGNTWTYKSGAAQVVVKITGVSAGKDWSGKPATVIDVEELYSGRSTKTAWSCTAAGGLNVGLDSFLWSGEPAANVGAQLTVTAREKPWLVPEDQFTGDVAWVEDVKADVARPDSAGAGVQHAGGKLEVERHAQLKGQERVMTLLGQFNADKVVFELRGRGIVGAEKAEIPIRRPATYWFVKGVGIVKMLDAFDKSWELTDSNLIAK